MFRLYGSSQLRKRFPLEAYAIPAGLIVLSVASLFSRLVLSLGLSAYLDFDQPPCYGTSLWHMSNLLPETKVRTHLSAKTHFKLFFQSITVYAIVQQLTNPAFPLVAGIYQHPLAPAALLYLADAVLLAGCLLFFSQIALNLLRTRRMPPAGADHCLYYQRAFHVRPRCLFCVVALCTGLFHGSQYLVVSASFRNQSKNDQCPEAKQPTEQKNVNHYLLLVIAGLIIYVGIPLLFSNLGINISIAFSAIFWAVNLHHFAIDGVIWKSPSKRTHTQLAHA